METKTRVTMVDDEPMFTSLAKRNLEARGDFEVDVVNDSSQAVQRIREFEPDVVLLDIIMPGHDGGDVLNSLEADPELASIPVLIVTAMIDHEHSYQDGVVKFGEHVLLAKPVSTDTLVECIRKTLEGGL